MTAESSRLGAAAIHREARMVAAGASLTQPLVGRDDVLARVEAALVDGEGVLLEGDPGMGKTALWHAGVEGARDRGARVLESRPGETERRLSFSALDDLLSGELDEVLPHLSPLRRRALEVALLRADEPDTSPDARAVSTAVFEVMRWLARDRAIVLALDDVQWLDRGSARTLTFALRRLDRAEVAVLATRRIGTDPSQVSLLRAFDERGVIRMTLSPLDLEAVDQIIRLHLDVRLSRPARRHVYRLSGGNPLFALELARSRGIEPVWSAGAERPDRLAWAIRRRVSTLPSPVREILCGAALTQWPSVTVVASVTGRSVLAVRDAIAAAERKGVAEIARDPRPPDHEIVAFRHPLFRSASAELLAPARVRALHRAYARVVDDPQELGRHLAASATSPDEEVAGALDAASRHARSRGALDAAAELSGLAARFTPDGEQEQRAHRTIAAAASLFDAGDRMAAEEHLRSRLDTIPSGVQRAKAFTALAIMCWNDLIRADDLLNQAEREAGQDPWTRAKVLATRAWVEAYSRSLDRAAAFAIEAITLAERHGNPVVRGALAALAWARLLQGKDATEALARGLAFGERYVRSDQCTPRLSAAMGRRWVGDLTVARELLQAEEEAISATGAETSLLEILGPLAEVLWRLGDWPGAADRLHLAAEIAKDVGIPPSRAAQWSHVDALLAIGQGRINQGLQIARDGAGIAVSVGDRFSEAHNLAALVVGLLAIGDAPGAVAAFLAARRSLEELGVREAGVLGVTGDGIEALAATGDLEGLAALVTDLEAASGGDRRPWAAAEAARGRAFLLDGEAGEIEMASAIDGYTRLGMPFESARCELWLGTWQRRRRQQRRARETLARAREAFSRLGAAPWETHAASELARVGGRSPASSELTAAERETVALVADGLTNADIAARVHVSTRTVEAHLSRAYAKLGVRSRTALLAKLRDT